jgi:Cof subfamily protein (haloacid dehalogenase superfamily)
LEQKIPYRVVAFDLDNTTLNRGEMSQATKQALKMLKSRGVITVAATGRHISLIPASIRRNKSIDYIICVTGSSIYRVKTREMTHLHQMTNEQATSAVVACKSLGARLNLVTRERAFAEKAAFQSFVKSSAVRGKSHGKTSIKQVLRLLKMMFASSLMDDAAGYLETHPDVGVQKIDAFFDEDAQTEEAVRLLTENGNFEVADSPRYLEITTKDCTKGNGLARLCERLGLTMQDVIAFGDSGNDLSMADRVALFVAMGNAEPAVLQRAGRIAPSVQEDGLAAVLTDIFSS